MKYKDKFLDQIETSTPVTESFIKDKISIAGITKESQEYLKSKIGLKLLFYMTEEYSPDVENQIEISIKTLYEDEIGSLDNLFYLNSVKNTAEIPRFTSNIIIFDRHEKLKRNKHGQTQTDNM